MAVVSPHLAALLRFFAADTAGDALEAAARAAAAVGRLGAVPSQTG